MDDVDDDDEFVAMDGVGEDVDEGGDDADEEDDDGMQVDAGPARKITKKETTQVSATKGKGKGKGKGKKGAAADDYSFAEHF